MAQLNLDDIQIQRKTNEHVSIHAKVKTKFLILTDESGQKYVQINTYGNSDREKPEQASQSLQLDKESAKFITKLLISTFDLLNINIKLD